MNEIDKFFDDLPSQDKLVADVFDEENPEKVPVEGEPKTPEEGDESEASKEARKNRRERRLEEKLQRSQQMNIELNERVKVLSETKQFQTEFKPSNDMPAEWIALYGDTPEAKRAWQMNESLINRAKKEAKDEALQEFESKQNKAVQEQKQFEGLIDSELESLEDDFNVDLTSNAPAARKARREFLEMVQDLSPKDEEGNITSYADFGKTFENYQKIKKTEKVPDPTVNRAKELASRSMSKSSSNSNQDVIDGPITFETARRAINKFIS